MLSGWGGGGGGEELELELVVSASFSELSLSDASSSTHILTAAPCLVTALLGLSNNIHVHFRFNAWLSPTGFINTAPFWLISPCSRTFFVFIYALVGPQCCIHTGSFFSGREAVRENKPLFLLHLGCMTCTKSGLIKDYWKMTIPVYKVM